MHNQPSEASILRSIYESEVKEHIQTKEKLASITAETMHWKRVAMLASGFSSDICDAILSAQHALTEEEMAIAKQMFESWKHRAEVPHD